MKRIALIIVLCFMSACSSSRTLQTSYSFHGVMPEQQAVSKEITKDLANYIATLFAPGHTSFNLVKAESENLELTDETIADTFTTIFENALRQKGFEISKKGLELSYTIDSLSNEFGEGGFYTQIRFGNGSNFSSVYTMDGKSLLTRSTLKLGDNNE